MGIEERRQRERDEVREKILDGARELFVECGYEGVTMRKVAERIEYSPTTIYLYFADKEALIRELCSADFHKLSESFQSVAGISGPIERLRACAQAYVQFAVNHPNHYRLMFMSAIPAAPTEDELARKGNPNEDAYAFLRAIVTLAIEAGAFRPEHKDVDLIAQTLWAAVHGVASLEITNKCDQSWVRWAPFQERLETMLNAIFRGIENPEARSKE
jgi:AcrR family transcriptional regulator